MENINFYPHKFEVTHSVENANKAPIGDQVSISGRVISIRPHGKISFIDITDEGNRIQLYFKAGIIGMDEYMLFKNNVTKGDFIGINGTIFKTKTGEQTVNVEKFQILCKAVYPLPSHWYGIKDIEYRYRNRHLDLIINPEVRTTFENRSRIIKEIRNHLDSKEFNEFETPIIQPVYGGADARPFTSYVNDLDEQRYLQISPELYLKRLVIGGFNKVYTITKNFRNESIDSHHNPEFTMMEVYEAYADYTDMMRFIQTLVTDVNNKLFATQVFEFRGQQIDFTPPWDEITMYESLQKYAGLNVEETSDDEIKSMLSQFNDGKVHILLNNYNRGLAIARLFDLLVEPKLIQPTFITDYPKETTSLCKGHRNNPDLIERFELFVCGMELANAYTELNDPHIQEELFLNQLERKKQGDDEAHPFDGDFIEALKYGMPPTGGLGIGIDRLVMIQTGSDSIKDVLLWPMLRQTDEN